MSKHDKSDTPEAPSAVPAAPAASSLSVEQLLAQMPKALAEAVTSAIFAQEALRQANAPKHMPRYRTVDRCPTCGQDKKACNDKHVKMEVLPASHVPHPQFFGGVRINGVRYGPGWAVVPEVMVDDIKGHTERWAQNERDQAQGRSGKHNSGHIGLTGNNNFNPAHAGWR